MTAARIADARRWVRWLDEKDEITGLQKGLKYHNYIRWRRLAFSEAHP